MTTPRSSPTCCASRGSRPRPRQAHATDLGTSPARCGLHPGRRAAGAAAAVGLQSGDLPTLTRWVRSGSHVATSWDVQLPSTTPASQAGLLHGASGQVPAFRWYEKDSGRLLVANHPRDAAEIQQRLSDGRGLLADGGVSISNIFTGDAPTALLTMSSVTGRGSRGPVARLRRVLHQPLRAEPLARAVRGGDAQGAVPGPATAAPRRAAADQPARLLRRCCAGRHERAAARPQRRADRRADDGRGTRRSTATSPTTTRSPTTPVRPGRSRWPRWPGSTTSSGCCRWRPRTPHGPMSSSSSRTTARARGRPSGSGTDSRWRS